MKGERRLFPDLETGAQGRMGVVDEEALTLKQGHRGRVVGGE